MSTRLNTTKFVYESPCLADANPQSSEQDDSRRTNSTRGARSYTLNGGKNEILKREREEVGIEEVSFEASSLFLGWSKECSNFKSFHMKLTIFANKG